MVQDRVEERLFREQATVDHGDNSRLEEQRASENNNNKHEASITGDSGHGENSR
jgi:hypothetical protein